MKPFSQQMGVTQGYSDAARMAMSHPAFLDQAERPQVHFGSAAQFGVKLHYKEVYYHYYYFRQKRAPNCLCQVPN